MRPRDAAGHRVPPDASRATWSSTSSASAATATTRATSRAFTQPQMYELIRTQPAGARALRAGRWREQGRIAEDEPRRSSRPASRSSTRRSPAPSRSSQFKEPSALRGPVEDLPRRPATRTPAAVTPACRTRRSCATLLKQLVRGCPRASPRTRRWSARCSRSAQSDGCAARSRSTGARARRWPTPRCSPRATRVRLTGQDTERGTFSHRHAVLHDVKTGEQYVPLRAVSRPAAAPFQVFNSPLSEMGCMGFEYGYSLDYPDGAGRSGRRSSATSPTARRSSSTSSSPPAEDKWRRLCGLTLLLPHGYEGAGPGALQRAAGALPRAVRRGQHPGLLPDHARADLPPAAPPGAAPAAQAAGGDDAQEPAARARRRAPPLDELATGRFQRRHPRRAELDPAKVTRLLLCSGKVYYDLLDARDETQGRHRRHRAAGAALPVPARPELAAEIARMPGCKSCTGCRRSRRTWGAWPFVLPRLWRRVSGRPEASRSATRARGEREPGHRIPEDPRELEQTLLIDAALSRGQHDGR